MAYSTSTRCCVVGGGPAGLMAGFLLARAGVDVHVLEKHGDFLRDFRGDTIHPSTLELMKELGLLEEFLALPHEKVTTFLARFGQRELIVGDFSRLPTTCRFIALMPQWDFLNFLADKGQRYPTFKLRMRTEATALIEQAGRVVGVSGTGPDGPIEVRADLVIGADGRHSVVRREAKLPQQDLGAPLDVLWFRISRLPTDPTDTAVRLESGQILVLINRGTYWQCGYVIAKGAAEKVKADGIDAFRAHLGRLVGFLKDRVGEIDAWEKLSLLTVQVDRLQRWHRPGLLCIGDAAHAMSPIGGVGVNLAVQDAVAAANLLAAPLIAGTVSEAHLAGIQRRREFPTRVTQRLQVAIQNRIIARALHGTGPIAPPRLLAIAYRIPMVRAMFARLLAVGVRPEHVAPSPVAVS